MKAVSAIIAVILILMIVVALAALVWLWLSGLFTSVTTTAGSSVEQTKTYMQTLFKIENINGNDIYIRNLGQNPITNSSIAAYLDDAKINFIAPSVINHGELGKITVDIISAKGYPTIKITSGVASDSKKLNYVFNDNFNDGNENGWTEYAANWIVENGEYSQDLNGYDRWTQAGENWTNYELSGKFKILNSLSPYTGNHSGFQVRAKDINNFYQFSFFAEYSWCDTDPGPGCRGIEISKHFTSWAHQTTCIPYWFDYNKWYEIKVSCIGNRFKIYVNGVFITEWVDSSSDSLYGKIGINTHDAHVHFDDIKVTLL
jgi:FlaG/FlaF family flagellin (archaellin)